METSGIEQVADQHLTQAATSSILDGGAPQYQFESY